MNKMWKRFVVNQTQRALLLREGNFERVLEPGVHRVMDPFNRYAIQCWSVQAPHFDHPLAETLRREQGAVVEQYFDVMDTTEDQVGLRFENKMLVEIVPPGARRLYWKGPAEARFEVVELAESAEVPAGVTRLLNQSNLRSRVVTGLAGVLSLQVPAWHVGVLKIDGKVERLLAPGFVAFWRFNREVSVELVDTRLQTLEVSGQEILTRDKVGLRVNLAATWRFADVLAAFAATPKPVEHLYRELQFGLRAAVGTRTLDELLENKQLIDEVVSLHLAKKLAGQGIEVHSVGVRDIVLPGEMKTILAQVVEAEKSAQANVIRRREETAATRSLLNTAKVMEENPTALRLKELETLERVAERIDRISVFGGLDQVLNGLVSIKTS